MNDKKQRDERILFYEVAEGGGGTTYMRPIEVWFWQWLMTHADHTDERRAERVADYIEMIHVAEAAEREGDVIKLREAADCARRNLGEPPERIPENGFPDELLIEWDPLTAAQIKERLLADIKRRHLESWFEAGEQARKAALQ